jgi:hypothetical protein
MKPSRRPSKRHAWVAWCMSALLLLNAAVPMLARAAAEWQGVAVGEVCELHGVPSAALRAAQASHAEHAGHAEHGDLAEQHDGDAAPTQAAKHCPLLALSALGVPHVPALDVVAPTPRADALVRPAVRPMPDAAARWAARLAHAPPFAS